MVILLGSIGVLSYLIYYNVPGNPVNLIEEKFIEEELKHIDYGETPMFWENLRFPTNEITYFIEPTCSEERKDSMIRALNIFANEVGIISFDYTDFSRAQILVGCSEDYVKLGKNLFAAGEGGPSEVVNTTNFKIIQSGKILLFKEPICDYPVVELHELSHVFGFDHTPNPKSIMFNTSKCDQRITPDMIKIVRELYSIKSIPDLKIQDLNGIKRGRYLDFNITITNEGLSNSLDFLLEISAGEKVVQEIEIEGINVGYQRILTAENIQLPSRSVEKITFKLDSKDEVEEINEENNILELTTS